MAGRRALVVAALEPLAARLIAWWAVAIAAAALAWVAAAGAHVGAALVTEQLLVAEHLLGGLATPTLLGHRGTTGLGALTIVAPVGQFAKQCRPGSVHITITPKLKVNSIP